MKILETHIHRGDNGESYGMGEESIDVADTIFEDDPTPGNIFRWCRREHGRCISKVYIDTVEHGTVHVGWVFLKREKYEDCNDTYLHETWISLLDKDELVRDRRYHHISKNQGR
jgi:hypothetical protein